MDPNVMTKAGIFPNAYRSIDDLYSTKNIDSEVPFNLFAKQYPQGRHKIKSSKTLFTTHSIIIRKKSLKMTDFKKNTRYYFGQASNHVSSALTP
jgi:hypothetical protein